MFLTIFWDIQLRSETGTRGQGPGVGCPSHLLTPACGCMPSVASMRRQASRQIFWGTPIAVGAAARERIPARESDLERNACATRNRTFATPVTHVRWFRRWHARGRDRTALRVNGRTKCEILFQSPWRWFCSVAGPWPRKLTTRARQESTGCLEQVFPRVGPRFVRAGIMRVAARFAVGV
jgi:hypothetical protein